MKLTPRTKEYIDSLSYEQLYNAWMLSPYDDDWFKGETGDYWRERMDVMYQGMRDMVGEE